MIFCSCGPVFSTLSFARSLSSFGSTFGYQPWRTAKFDRGVAGCSFGVLGDWNPMLVAVFKTQSYLMLLYAHPSRDAKDCAALCLLPCGKSRLITRNDFLSSAVINSTRKKANYSRLLALGIRIRRAEECRGCDWTQTGRCSRR